MAPRSICFLVLLISGLARAETGTPKPLFQRLGGRAIIMKAAAHFLETVKKDVRLMRNPAIKQAAEIADPKRLSLEITERVCAVSGGKCVMRPGLIETIGSKIKLSTMEWVYVVSDLNDTLTQYKVPRAEQAEFLELVLKSRP